MLLEKPKQIKKQRPFLSARLISSGCLSSEDFIWMKIVQKHHFGEDFPFSKCILYTHKSVYEENLLKMHGVLQ